MKTMIYCEPTDRGVHSFFMSNNGREYYLFSQAYRKGVDEYYGKGVLFCDAMKYSKAHNDSAIIRTMSKIPMYVRYIEQEYGIEILDRTKKKSRQGYKRTICA